MLVWAVSNRPFREVEVNDHEHLNGSRMQGIFSNGKNYIKKE